MTFAQDLESFRLDEPARGTIVTETVAGKTTVPTYVNEFWTSKQRDAHSLHEISYRACFKPQLPRFFIERLTKPDDVVYDPHNGRGTTVLETAFLGRRPIGCDVSPLSGMLTVPRLDPPRFDAVEKRLREIKAMTFPHVKIDADHALLVFYHPTVLLEICRLKNYLNHGPTGGAFFDGIDGWIRMVAVNRLTGHSPGFFSVYTLPPNQAVSAERQAKINADKNQVPPERDIYALILKKTKALLKDLTEAERAKLLLARAGMQFFTSSCDSTPSIKDASVDLVVTSPPFLDVVDYAGDNWLRCWFCGIDPGSVKLTQAKRLEDWQAAMTKVFRELARVLKPGGHVAFEVGEIKNGKIKLEEATIPCGEAAGLKPEQVMINAQEFTKTAKCWGVDNGKKGTNTNRIVLFRKN